MLTSVHTQPSSVNRAAAFSAMRRVPVILAAILVSQAALGVTLQNGPFQDEATFLYAGRQYADHLAGGPPVTEPYATYFAGLPYLQPLALGALSQLGGVEGARALSTCLMLAVTLGVFFLTALLFDQRAGLFAAALFGLQAPVLFLGRLASYDSGCVALLTFAAVLAVASARVAGWRGMALAGCVAFLLAGAFFVKFSALMFAPAVVALLAVESGRHGGFRAVAARFASVAMVWLLLAAVALLFLRASLVHDVWSGVALNVSVTRIGGNTLFQVVRDRFFDLVWLFALVAGVGAGLLARRRRLLVTVLVGAFFIAPLYHLTRGEMVSLHKHVAYGAVFAAPLAGYAVGRWWGGVGEDGLGFRRLTTVALIGWVASIGWGGAQLLYHEWPDGSAAAEVIRRELASTSRVLAEEFEIPRLAAYGMIPDKHWVSTEWTSGLYLWTYPMSRAGSRGVAAMREAIHDGWFDLILFRYGPNERVARELDREIRASGHYTEIASIPYTTRFGAARYLIWKRVSSLPA